MTNVVHLSGTQNSSQAQESQRVAESDASLGFLFGDRRDYALNLIQEWSAQMRHLDGLQPKSCKSHSDNLFRLINHAGLAPWELRKHHVTKYLDSRVDAETGRSLSPATVAARCSAWRSFQCFMLELDRANEILARFKIRPSIFINEENGIAVKKYKANWIPRGWALTPEEIVAIDEAFCWEIEQAFKLRSKSLLPLQRDRVMFHIAIHFALRVGELVTLDVTSFRASHDPNMASFGQYGVLTVTGKNNVTGSIPMREPIIHQLLEWYLANCRQRLLLRRKIRGDGGSTCSFDGKDFLVGNLLFPSERGRVVEPNGFRKRLRQIAVKAGVLKRKLTPHTLRHTGCTLMVPLYSPEIAQKYMRHKNLGTTLYYYHPSPLQAGNEVNAAMKLFRDDLDDELEG